MVCRGGPRTAPWYSVNDAMEGFAADGATACRDKDNNVYVSIISWAKTGLEQWACYRVYPGAVMVSRE